MSTGAPSAIFLRTAMPLQLPCQCAAAVSIAGAALCVLTPMIIPALRL